VIASIVVVATVVSSFETRSPLDSPPAAIGQAALMPAPPETSQPAPTGASPTMASAAARMKSAMASAPAHGWVFLSEGPVLAPGPPAAFDGFYVSNPAIVREDDRHYQAWYRGCRLHGRTHDCAIGHAVSPDGLVWNADDRPALVPLEGADEFHLGGMAVVRVDGTYYLWYSVEANSFSSRSSSPLYLATSHDGSQWTQHGRVLTATEQLPRYIEPTVVHDGRQFHLWFVDSMVVFEGPEKKQPPDGPFLRHLTSADGRAWQDAAQFPLGPIDRGRVKVSVARDREGSYRAFYFGRLPGSGAAAIGWLLSADGNEWRVASTVPVNVRALGDDVRDVPYVTGLRDGTGVRMWFVTQRTGGRQEVRAAFYKEQG
jgi:hypothetical protein